MRVLVLLRGAAGCGKSTWVKENGLEKYTLSPDTLREMCQSPELQADGSLGFSQERDTTSWKTLFKILEIRMQRGEFTVIDAINAKSSEMSRYKEMCSVYRYRIFCVDFTGIPIEEVKRRNAGREPLKRVPDSSIEKTYSRFATQGVPSGIKVIKPEELDSIWMKCFDFSEYKKVHCIGDVRGCNTVLQEYFSSVGGIKDDEMYIFLGNYANRGIENAATIQFLLSIKDRKNVLLLEGKSDRTLWLWANDTSIRHQEFILTTQKELEKAKIEKKDVRQLYRKFAQCAYFRFGDREYLVTHAGLSTIPKNLTLVATDQMLKGVGKANQVKEVADAFAIATAEKCCQIHAGRNVMQLPIQVNDKVFNLEGQVEYGGYLRCVQISSSGIDTIAIKNEVYKLPEILTELKEEEKSIAEIVKELRENPFVEEKVFGNISSFNYTEKAFFDSIWDEQTVKASGLFIDVSREKIVARSYEKFFNTNERPETKLDMLQHKLQFPVTAYVKENGFLGIVSYNEETDDLLITSKSSLEGSGVEWFKEILHNTVTPENLEAMKEYVKENNVSMIFECEDPKNDPHIIDYSERRIVLLDVIFNQLKFKKLRYDEVCHVALKFGLIPKTKAYEIADWSDYFDWYYDVMEEDYEFEGNPIEGFVVEDSVGYSVKLKLSYYKFWKFMRDISHEAIRNGRIRKTAALTTPLANEFYGWVRKFNQVEDKDSIPKDICTLRRLFYKEKASKQSM